MSAPDTASQASDAWAEPEFHPGNGAHDPKLVKTLTEKMGLIFKEYAGPSAYLKAQLSSKEQRDEFNKWLWDTFPEKDDVFYVQSDEPAHISNTSQMSNQLPLAVHIIHCAWDDDCSLKSTTAQCTANELTDDGISLEADHPHQNFQIFHGWSNRSY